MSRPSMRVVDDTSAEHPANEASTAIAYAKAIADVLELVELRGFDSVESGTVTTMLCLQRRVLGEAQASIDRALGNSAVASEPRSE